MGARLLKYCGVVVLEVGVRLLKCCSADISILTYSKEGLHGWVGRGVGVGVDGR